MQLDIILGLIPFQVIGLDPRVTRTHLGIDYKAKQHFALAKLMVNVVSVQLPHHNFLFSILYTSEEGEIQHFGNSISSTIFNVLGWINGEYVKLKKKNTISSTLPYIHL